MSDDLYSLWLKLPPGPRPLDHYALLGIPRFCADLEQIETAAQKQLDVLDRYAMVPNLARRDACHQMMNEVARAKLVLSDLEKRAAYDRELEPTRSLPSARPRTSGQWTQPLRDARSRVLRFAMAQPVLWATPLACLIALAVLWHLFGRSDGRPSSGNLASISKSSDAPARTSSGNDSLLAPAPPIVTPTGSAPTTGPAAPGRSASTIASHPNTASSPAPRELANTPTPPPVERSAPAVALTGTPKSSGSASGGLTAPEPAEPSASAQAPSRPVTPPLTPTTAPPAVPSLQPVPAAAAQDVSGKLVDDIFAADVAGAIDPASKSALAKKMLDLAGQSQDDVPGCFVLLKRASDLAASAGDIQTTLAAIDRTAQIFQIDALRIRARALLVVSKTLSRGAEHLDLTHQMDATIDRAVLEDRYDIAQSVVHGAIATATATNDADWLTRSRERNTELQAAAADFDKVKQAQATLAAQPDNPSANTAVGRYRCLTRNDWARGLPMLVKGSDPVTRKLADSETRATDAQSMLGVANGWWALADREAPRARASLISHAGAVYRKASPQLAGVQKTLAEKRMEEAESVGKRVVDLIPLVDVRAAVGRNHWKTAKGGVLMPADFSGGLLPIPYRLPDEYDVRLTFQPQATRGSVILCFMRNGEVCGVDMGIAWMNGFKSAYSFDNINGQNPNPSTAQGPVLEGDRSYTAIVKVRRTSLSIFLDDERVSFYEGDLKSSVQIAENTVRSGGLGLGGGSRGADAAVLFTKIELIEFTGHGATLGR